MHRASSYSMYMNQQDAQNSCDRTLFLLDALQVADYISPSSGANFIATQQPDVWYRHIPNAMYSL